MGRKVFCKLCGNEVLLEDMRAMVSREGIEELACPSCTEGYLQCDSCGYLVPPEYTIVEDDGTVCCIDCRNAD